MIGYYILYMDNRFGRKISDPADNFFNLLKEKRDDYLEAKNKWANHQISSLRMKDGARFLNEDAFNHFNKLIEVNSLQSGAGSQISYDTNFIEYIEQLYIKGFYTNYNPDINYKYLNRNYYIDQIMNFELLRNKQSSLSGEEKEEFLEKILGYWYLVGSKYWNEHELKTSFEAADVCLDIYITQQGIKSGFFISASKEALFSKADSYEDILFYTIEINQLDNNQYSNFLPVKVYFTPDYSFSAGYRLKLKSEPGFLSFIESGLCFTLLTAGVDDPDIRTSYIGAYEEVSHGVYHRFRYTKDGVYPSNKFLFSFSSMAPVYYFTKWLSVECGATASFHSLSLEYKILKEKLDAYRSTGEIETLRREENYTKFSILPAARVVFNIYRGLSLNFEISGYYGKYIPSIDLKYGFW